MVDRQGRSELHYSALEGTADQARALLAAGQDPNSGDRDGFVPLHLAAQQGNVAVAEVLLEAGATVDAVNKYGNTPLFVAAFHSRGRGEVIRLLRRHGADPNRVNGSGQTPAGLARLIANYDVRQFFEDVD
ncbi:ankyrin repeat domain-containing protein [Amycolatopsis australiensis]|uniref:Ankyrin repeat-containing protein n=1 Tax=Amycolatopsis australiensis TaxID=546364 RepID=A0A1K1T726_9PSEU|nr:ankyrin repeat domain-containing protein [Amycolatopsis australiensis]SFW91837.1 Ankyrin repeat-containing protein [Amycolatopsis australiensis]